MEPPAIQDRIRPFGHTCFGCGQDNPHGLRIRSFWEHGEAVAHWQPEAWHVAGPGFLNGGIIATLLDCHMGAAATAHAYEAAGRPLGAEPAVVVVTATLKVDYLKPTPVDGPVELRARVTEEAGRRIHLSASLLAGGEETARAESVFVRVDDRAS